MAFLTYLQQTPSKLARWKRLRSLPHYTLEELGLTEAAVTLAELPPLTLRQYIDLVSDLPLPTQQQKETSHFENNARMLDSRRISKRNNLLRFFFTLPLLATEITGINSNPSRTERTKGGVLKGKPWGGRRIEFTG